MNEKEIELTSREKAIKVNSEKEANLVQNEIVYTIKILLLICFIMLIGFLIGIGI